MQHSAIHDPRSKYTPSQRREADRRRDRLAKIGAKARPDTPISCLSASQRSASDVIATQEPAPVIQQDEMVSWLERQKQIPLPYSPTQQLVQIKDVQVACAKHYGVELKAILSSSRLRRFVKPRQVAMFLASELTGKSSLKVGRAFFRDHATALWAIRKIGELAARDEMLAHEIAAIKTSFAGAPV